MERRRFKKSTVKSDCAVLENWRRGVITPETAKDRLCKNNGWEQITVEEFIELAHSLGYWERKQ